MNSLKKKTICLRDIISISKIDVLCIDKTKLDAAFQTANSELMGTSFFSLEKIEIRKAVEK